MKLNLENKELMELAANHADRDTIILEIDKLLSAQKKQTQLHKDEYERLNVIIDLIPNTISWVNRDMTYFAVNRALADSCGIKAEEFTGKVIGFHTREKFFFDFVTDLFASPNRTIYRELEAKIGEAPHHYLVSGTKLSDPNRAVVIGVDITELTQLKGHVSFTEKLALLGEMFAGIIHDINNPLMMIEGNVKRIKKMTDDSEAHELLNKIEMSSKKISKIVQGIKVYIRQDGTQPFQLEELGEILNDAVVICENKLKDRDVTLHMDQNLFSIKVDCNFTQIFQVFVNLITNAIDAISSLPNKWINIKLLGTDENVVKIQFQDSGAGIPKEHQDKIFNAFFTTKERGIGSGLGLSLCTKILETHGGKLSIDNTLPNTTFVIELRKK